MGNAVRERTGSKGSPRTIEVAGDDELLMRVEASLRRSRDRRDRTRSARRTRLAESLGVAAALALLGGGVALVVVPGLGGAEPRVLPVAGARAAGSASAERALAVR